MKENSKQRKGGDTCYTVRRCFSGMRTAEEVVAALVRAHR